MIQAGASNTYVLAEPGRVRDSVKRQYIRVKDKVKVCFNNRIYAGVVEQKGAGGKYVIRYVDYKGQSQEYGGGDWRNYVIKDYK